MKKDRTYYRDMPHNALREEADYGIDVDWKELAIALTERLDTIRAEVYEETRDMCMCMCDCDCY
jgi:hypothetical protein